MVEHGYDPSTKEVGQEDSCTNKFPMSVLSNSKASQLPQLLFSTSTTYFQLWVPITACLACTRPESTSIPCILPIKINAKKFTLNKDGLQSYAHLLILILINVILKHWGFSSAAEWLPSKHEALCLVFNTKIFFKNNKKFKNILKYYFY